ncbi:hypothetical protein TNCV_4798171 [Trichonephila clavipes]|nr:hypothetical protein TNCV_4798171 [Trichonephila clavipes]
MLLTMSLSYCGGGSGKSWNTLSTQLTWVLLHRSVSEVEGTSPSHRLHGFLSVRFPIRYSIADINIQTLPIVPKDFLIFGKRL